MLAERVITLHPNEPFTAVMVFALHNDKYAFHAKRLAQRCTHFIAVDTPFGFWNSRQLYRRWKADDHLRTARNVFVASIDHIVIRMLVSICVQARVYTFDDGTLNYDEESVIVRSLPEQSKWKVLLQALPHSDSRACPFSFCPPFYFVSTASQHCRTGEESEIIDAVFAQ